MQTAIPNTIAENIAKIPNSQPLTLSIEHPTGEFTVNF